MYLIISLLILAQSAFGAEDPFICGKMFAEKLCDIQGAQLEFPDKFRTAFNYRPKTAIEHHLQALPRFQQFLEYCLKPVLIQAALANHKCITLHAGWLPPETGVPPWLTQGFINFYQTFFPNLRVMWHILLKNQPSPLSQELYRFSVENGLTLLLQDQALSHLNEAWIRSWDFEAQKWGDWVRGHHSSHPQIRIYWLKPSLATPDAHQLNDTFATEQEFYKWFETNDKFSGPDSIAGEFNLIPFAAIEEFVSQQPLSRKAFFKWIKEQNFQ